MSTIDTNHSTQDKTRRRDSLDSMTPRERLLGMLVVILVLLLAIVLRSL